MLAQCAGTAGAQAPPAIDPTVRAAVRTGQARVLIELRLVPAWRPEGDLPNAAAVEAQRRAIARARDEVLARVRGSDFALGREYDTLPYLALRISADALGRLEAAGDVIARVAPDGPLSPQR